MNDQNDHLEGKTQSQFGLRSLMLLMAFIASLFATLRALNVSATQTIIGIAAVLFTITLTILMIELTRSVR